MNGSDSTQTRSRTYNTMRNIGWGFARRLVALVGPFIIRMLLIQQLGSTYLGLSTFFTSLLQILNLAELGFSSAVAFCLYEPIAKENDTEIARYINYLQQVYRFIGLAIVVAGALLIPFLPALTKGETPADVSLVLAYAIFVANTAAGYFLYAHKQTLLIAHQRKDVVDRVSTLVLAVQFVAQAILLLIAPNFYTYALVLPACTIASNIILARQAARFFPQFDTQHARNQRLGKEERAQMRNRVAGLVLQKAAILTRDPFTAVVVSAVVGLAAVASFGNYFVVIGGVLGILSVIGASMTAAVGNSIAVENVQKNFEDLRLFVYMYAGIASVCAAIILVLYQPFMTLWVGQDLVLPQSFAVMMVVYFYIRTMGDMRTVYVDATGVWWKLRWRALAETLGNVVSCVICVSLWGLWGAAFALIVSLFVFNFAYGSHLIFKLYFGLEKAASYYIDHLLYALICAGVCAITFIVASCIPDGGVGLFIVKALVASLCAIGLVGLAYTRSPLFARARRFVVRAPR